MNESLSLFSEERKNAEKCLKYFFLFCCLKIAKTFTLFIIIIRPGNPQHNILISFIQKK